ncbi:siroheme synthase CysG [Neptunicella sp. SCSIO 80796]|uniref:siroheme synthase CysG n=1 Tax=Neptunicella plasticusilytica TaxID=3117012 RepID=UPI003A4D3536
MDYFPVFLNAKHINCLVVGAGEVAARKAELLAKTPAHIRVVAPQACQTIQSMASQQQLEWIEREFDPGDIQGQQLIFVATDDHQLNCDISTLAKAANIPVNVVDNTELCSFITPSIVDRDPLLVALSSSGTAPVLLRYLRQKLESILPARLSDLAKFSDKFRNKVKQQFSSVNQRRNFWEEVIEGPIAETVLGGNNAQAEKLLLQKLAQSDDDIDTGCVYLVGAGPGDPDLLTFKALRLMQKADLVVYDRLVSKQILELVRRDAEKIYVGKKASLHSVPQDEINQLLVDAAKQGKRVVRLKGGDPYIFGRGGEEAETLVEQGINFQVVPGITAATGASTYAGIPLTHRDHAQSVVFSTGHLKDGSIDLDWPALARQRQTMVFYMGLTGLNVISEQLIQHGVSADMPVAVVQSATTEKQQVVVGTLSDIEQKVIRANIQPPALIIVGTVVNLRNKLLGE